MAWLDLAKEKCSERNGNKGIYLFNENFNFHRGKMKENTEKPDRQTHNREPTTERGPVKIRPSK